MRIRYSFLFFYFEKGERTYRSPFPSFDNLFGWRVDDGRALMEGGEPFAATIDPHGTGAHLARRKWLAPIRAFHSDGEGDGDGVFV